MDGTEAVHLVAGIGSPKLVATCRRMIKDLEEVEEIINDLEWMFSNAHPYLRPLLHRGFRARMGIGLPEWERLMDLMLESCRDLEWACFGDSEELLLERVQVFLEYYEPTRRALNMLNANMAAIAQDARELISEEQEIRSVESRTESQTRALGDLLTTMNAMREAIGDGGWLTVRAPGT